MITIFHFYIVNWDIIPSHFSLIICSGHVFILFTELPSAHLLLSCIISNKEVSQPMDATTLKTYIGPQYYDALTPLLDEEGKLPYSISLKNPRVTLILSICLGFLGIDRLYQGGVKIFLCKLAMLVFSLGTWWLADIGYAPQETRRINYEKIIARSQTA